MFFEGELGKRLRSQLLTHDVQGLLCDGRQAAEAFCGAHWWSWSWRQRSRRIGPVGEGHKVSKFERLLMRGSTELPECRCGSDMKIIKSDSIGSDAQVRTYQCPLCEHELRLTMWGTS